MISVVNRLFVFLHSVLYSGHICISYSLYRQKLVRSKLKRV